jgi:hypothetical protein
MLWATRTRQSQGVGGVTVVMSDEVEKKTTRSCLAMPLQTHVLTKFVSHWQNP